MLNVSQLGAQRKSWRFGFNRFVEMQRFEDFQRSREHH